MADASARRGGREGPRTGKLISFNLAGDQRPPTGFTAPPKTLARSSHIDFRAFQHPAAREETRGRGNGRKWEIAPFAPSNPFLVLYAKKVAMIPPASPADSLSRGTRETYLPIFSFIVGLHVRFVSALPMIFPILHQHQVVAAGVRGDAREFRFRERSIFAARAVVARA